MVLSEATKRVGEIILVSVLAFLLLIVILMVLLARVVGKRR